MYASSSPIAFNYVRGWAGAADGEPQVAGALRPEQPSGEVGALRGSSEPGRAEPGRARCGGEPGLGHWNLGSLLQEKLSVGLTQCPAAGQFPLQPAPVTRCQLPVIPVPYQGPAAALRG